MGGGGGYISIGPYLSKGTMVGILLIQLNLKLVLSTTSPLDQKKLLALVYLPVLKEFRSSLKQTARLIVGRIWGNVFMMYQT